LNTGSANWPDRSFVRQITAQIPWFHNCILPDRIPDPATGIGYIKAAIEHGWSRNILEIQIDTCAHERQGKAVANCDRFNTQILLNKLSIFWYNN